MANSIGMYAIAAGAVILGAAAIVTAQSPATEKSPLRVAVVTTGELPLVYNRPREMTDIMPAGRDQLVAAKLRRAVQLSDWSVGPMGDGKAGAEFLDIDANFTSAPHSAPGCMSIAYRPGPTGWAGGYWLTSADNWGKLPGADLRGFSNVVFFAKGKSGKERVEFKAGGIDATRMPGVTHKDSFGTSLGKMTLGQDWREYRISLEGLDLSSVVGGFAWVATVEDNPDGVTFYLDDIHYE